ncbi:MAG: PrgI family protein [Candidatus Sungiibacteriota bacterium]|uniref:PrgI family protein n=1 Tax=Candidatus Sungiibacteriota bacterium TaxID=2750080 RepID=A0A7T5UQA5_9BACT|nr:MAG: PrgI family protein [Candidatus Sungbacteria bacterium]
MRQFQVPQFITVEDRVIGPLTIRQALYVGAGVLLVLGARTLLEPFLFVPTAILIGVLTASLAFLKIGERPFPLILKNAVFYLLRPRLYIWKKSVVEKKPAGVAAPKSEVLVKSIPKLSQSKLSDLAWSLDIKEKANPPPSS